MKKVDYFLIRVSSNNAHSKHVVEKMGAVRIGEEETDFSRFVQRFGNKAKEKRFNLEEYRYLFEENDDEVLYRYRLNPNIFYEMLMRKSRADYQCSHKYKR